MTMNGVKPSTAQRSEKYALNISDINIAGYTS
jgi:hypothetical protein